jgi:hypothetical protein
MDKLEIKQGSFIQQTQYFIPVGIDFSVLLCSTCNFKMWEKNEVFLERP